MRDIKQSGQAASFLYSGGTKELIRVLAVLDFEDVTITDPDIEDVFMHYYTGEAK